MNIRIIDSAEAEFVGAVQRYNKESEGLGYEFAAEVKRTILRIEEFPHAWPLFSKRTHRCRTNKFPYGVLYQLTDDSILIVAIMHLHRNPKIWKERIQRR